MSRNSLLEKGAKSEIEVLGSSPVARIRHIIKDGGQQIHEIAPQIIQGAIEDVYKTPFRLLGNFGKQKLSQIKRKISKLITK